MQKTKLGISVGLLGAAICFIGLFGGFFVAVVLAGYALLCEENAWLKRTAVKAVTVMVCCTLLMLIINLVPNVMGLISNAVSIFHGNFYASVPAQIAATLVSGIDIAEKIIMLGLGFKALNQGTIVIPVIDRLISRYMD